MYYGWCMYFMDGINVLMDGTCTMDGTVRLP